ncbi:adenylate/guanylate cyclase domain-containing protein [Undibacterium flavidum]|uniref:Adenylate/guanylate cyclase domain-containing protein n=1 Tax=Undibacterium flavidum TaxID=2762297 RepID=A0ABR6Y8W7_9BURK|nr:adenylate/guanylate cyclase domain-containing protein [Undibacterium flavidum]MBC3873055.1 adenylate/guanylate cyclase domain-containing protein [Undibacterium flavidum]
MRFPQTRFLTSLCVLLVVVFAGHFSPELTSPIDRFLSDWRSRVAIQWTNYQARRHSLDSKERRLVLIDIDEKSVAIEGAWPWPREKIAALLESLVEHYHASGVALDIVFPEARENDAVLAKQIKRSEVTGSVIYDLQSRHLPQLSYQLPSVMGAEFAKNAPRIIGQATTSNHPGIMPLRIGHITPVIDDDGAIRKIPGTICAPGRDLKCIPLFEASIMSGLLEQPQLRLQAGTGFFASPWELLVSDGIGSVVAHIPLDRDGLLAIPYRHLPSDWTAFSATDILRRRIDVQNVQSTIALIGSTAMGMADVIATPINPNAAGLEPHAEILSAMLDDSFSYRPRYAELLVLSVLFPLLLLLNYANRRWKKSVYAPLIYPVWLAIAFACGFVFSLGIYLFAHLLLPLFGFLIFPPLAILIYVLFALYRSNTEYFGLQKLMSTYLPKQVTNQQTDVARAQRIMDTSIDAARREITVLFADVRGFTGLVETQSPEVIAVLMDKVFGEMASAVIHHGGTIDKFIGDAVMAFWSGNEHQIDSKVAAATSGSDKQAADALMAAIEMHQRIQNLTDFCTQLGLPPVSISIGIESGMAIVGHFGSEQRRTYTAFGDVVVVASRLEALAAQFQEHILLGQGCAQQLDQDKLRHLGQTQIRGRSQSIQVFAPL